MLNHFYSICISNLGRKEGEELSGAVYCVAA